jgi:hypothetical protein
MRTHLLTTTAVASPAALPARERDPITVTVPQACRLSGYGLTTLWRLIKENRLRVVRVPGIDRTLVDYNSLRQLLTPDPSNTIKTKTPPPRRRRGRPRTSARQAPPSRRAR